MDAYSNPPSIEILTFLQSVVTRPRMYTPNGTRDEILSFLAGIEVGLSHVSPEGEREFKDLMAWLHDVAMRSVGPSFPSRDLIGALETKFATEEDFFSAAREFLAKRAKSIDLG